MKGNRVALHLHMQAGEHKFEVNKRAKERDSTVRELEVTDQPRRQLEGGWARNNDKGKGK